MVSCCKKSQKFQYNMVFLYFFVLITLCEISLSYPQQNPDLSPLLPNYEVVEAFDENFESWDDSNNDVIVFETVADGNLNKLCKNSNAVIYIKQEDLVFDCKLLKSDPIQEKHEIVKRSPNEEEEEGSGNDNGGIIVEAAADQTIKTFTQKDTIFPENPVKNQDNIGATEKSLEDNVTHEPTSTENLFTDSETVKTSGFSDDKIGTNISTNDALKENEVEQENKTEQIIDENTQTFTTVEVSSKTDTVEKEVEIMTVTKNDEENINNKEDWHKKINTNNTGSGRNLLPNKENSNDDDRVKESKEPQKAASKDTTILVVLFAAVVVVGAAAFAYNFFKKRRQHNADAERLERATNGKSNTNKVNEAEEKPLMSEKKEVEMVQLIKNVSESPNDATVKT